MRFEQIEVGSSATTSVVYDESYLNAFIDLSKDRAPVHCDAGFARTMGYDNRIVHGFLVGVAYSRLLGMELPGPQSIIQNTKLDMLKPVYLGDTLEHRVEVAHVAQAVQSVMLKLSATNQNGELVNRGTATCVMRASSPAAHEAGMSRK